MGIPICGACRRPIEERVVTALGKHWCVPHFVCAKCEHVEESQVGIVGPVGQILTLSNIILEERKVAAHHYLNVGHVQQLSKHKDGRGLQSLLDELHGCGSLGILGEEDELLQRVDGGALISHH